MMRTGSNFQNKGVRGGFNKSNNGHGNQNRNYQRFNPQNRNFKPNPK